MAALGQQYALPSHAALICSLESVFASLAGYVWLSESLTSLEIFGCVLMTVSTVLSHANHSRSGGAAVSLGHESPLSSPRGGIDSSGVVGGAVVV